MFKLQKIIAIPLLLVTCIALISCSLRDLSLIAQFNEIDSLKAGDRILFQNHSIGKVSKISRNDQGHYLLKLNIDAEHKNQLTVYSIFYIDKDPERPTREAVFTEQTKPDGTPLTDNSVIVGLENPPVLRHMLEDFNRKTEELASKLAEKLAQARRSYEGQSKELNRQVENALAEIDRQLREFEKTVRTAPDSQQAKELEKNLDKMVSDLQTRLREIAISIGQELSNRLQKSLDNLKHRLDELKQEEQKREKLFTEGPLHVIGRVN